MTTITDIGLRQLDAQIYERVFGLPVMWTNDEPAFDYEADDMMMSTEPFDWLRRYGYDVLHFSTDIGAAWEVVEKMRAQGWIAIIDNHEEWHCNLWRNAQMSILGRPPQPCPVSSAPTAPLAICRCALKVLEDN